MAILLSAALPLFLFLFFLYKWLSNTNQYSTKGKNLPPSPPKLPIIGNLHQIGNTIDPRNLLALSQKYGDLMFLQLGVMPVLVISSAKMACEIFKTHDSAFCGRPKLTIARFIMYECKDMICAAYGEHWRQLRAVSLFHLLSTKRVQSFRKVREQELALMIENIKKTTSLVNLSNMFSTLTNDVICRAAFGRKYKLYEDGVGFEQMLKDFIMIFGHSNVEDILPWMGWINRFNGFNAKASEVGRVFDRFVERIVEDHATRTKEGRSNADDDGETMEDFVDILLQLQRDNNPKTIPIDKEVIKGVIMDIFVAGTHTMNVAMEWTFTEILRHPKIMKRLQEEVRGIVGEKESVEEEDLDKLTYLKAVIKEAFRLHPPVPSPFPRESLEDVRIKGYDIPKGTVVITSLWAIGRDPECWENANEFIPERFLDSPIDYRGQHFELIPFGSGRRGCPGISFAMANIEIVLANLLHRFDWSVPVEVQEESFDLTMTWGAFSHKKTNLIAVAAPRKY